MIQLKWNLDVLLSVTLGILLGLLGIFVNLENVLVLYIPIVLICILIFIVKTRTRYWLLEKYFAFWSIVIPISSVVVFTSIKGTTPGFLFALIAIVLITIVAWPESKGYIRDILMFELIFIIYNTISQFSLAVSDVDDFIGLRMVNPYDSTLLFRSTMFTQSLYLLAVISTFFFIKNFYKRHWDKYIFRGAMVLALYGLYEVVYFILFHQNGDFLSNRTFGHGGQITSGSFFQTITIGSMVLQRLKSLTGEPSMYAFTILPYWIYAVHTRKNFTHVFLLITLILTTSTTAVFGILVYLLIMLGRLEWKNQKYIIGLIVFVAIASILNGSIFEEFFNRVVVEKITLVNNSGNDRFNSFLSSIEFFLNSNFLTQLFGVGFGYIRSTDFFSTLLVNNGIIGIIVWTLVFFYPILKLGNSYREIGLKSAIMVIYITMMIAVSEFSYLSTWLFLGIAYNEILVKRRRFRENTY